MTGIRKFLALLIGIVAALVGTFVMNEKYYSEFAMAIVYMVVGFIAGNAVSALPGKFTRGGHGQD